MQTAFDRLHEYYLPSPEYWWEHVEIFAELGIAHLSPECCLLARWVLPEWTDDEIIFGKPLPGLAQDLLLTHTHLAAHIHIATGSLTEVRRLLEEFFAEAGEYTFQRHGGPLLRIPATKLDRLCPR